MTLLGNYFDTWRRPLPWPLWVLLIVMCLALSVVFLLGMATIVQILAMGL